MKMRINRDLELVLQQIDFALWETHLFLDTHPECAAAMAYYKKLVSAREEAKKQYEAQCGPVTHRGVKQDRWTWVDGPWPWQNEV